MTFYLTAETVYFIVENSRLRFDCYPLWIHSEMRMYDTWYFGPICEMYKGEYSIHSHASYVRKITFFYVHCSLPLIVIDDGLMQKKFSIMNTMENKYRHAQQLMMKETIFV